MAQGLHCSGLPICGARAQELFAPVSVQLCAQQHFVQEGRQSLHLLQGFCARKLHEMYRKGGEKINHDKMFLTKEW